MRIRLAKKILIAWSRGTHRRYSKSQHGAALMRLSGPGSRASEVHRAMLKNFTVALNGPNAAAALAPETFS